MKFFRKILGGEKKSALNEFRSLPGFADLEDALRNASPDEIRQVSALSLLAAASYDFASQGDFRPGLEDSEVLRNMGKNAEGWSLFEDAKLGIHVEAARSALLLQYVWPNPEPILSSAVEQAEQALAGLGHRTSEIVPSNPPLISEFVMRHPDTGRGALILVGPVTTPFVSSDNRKMNGIMTSVWVDHPRARAE